MTFAYPLRPTMHSTIKNKQEIFIQLGQVSEIIYVFKDFQLGREIQSLQFQKWLMGKAFSEDHPFTLLKSDKNENRQYILYAFISPMKVIQTTKKSYQAIYHPKDASIFQPFQSNFDSKFHRIIIQGDISIHSMKITLLIACLAVCTCASSVPSITYSQSYQTYTYSAYPNDTCSKLLLTNNYIFRLGTNNVVSAVNKTSLIARANMLNYTYSLAANGSLATPNLVKDFDVDTTESYITIAQATTTRILNLMGFTLKMSSVTAPLYKVTFSNLVLVGALHNTTALTDLFVQNVISGAAMMASSVIILSPKTLLNVKNCQCKESPNRNIHVYWDQYSNVFVYNFTNASLAPVYVGTVPSNCTRANLTQTISFSSDSQYFIIEADNQLPVKIVSLVPGSLLSIQSFSFNGTINKAMFLDSKNSFIVLFNDSAAALFDVASLSLLYSSPFSFYTFLIEIDYTSGQIYVCKNSTVDIYNSKVVVVNCSSNCQRCINSSGCQACAANYTLVNNTCVLNLSSNPANTSNNTNKSNASSTNTSSSSTANSTTANTSSINATKNASSSTTVNNATSSNTSLADTTGINATNNNATVTPISNTTNLPINSTSTNNSSLNIDSTTTNTIKELIDPTNMAASSTNDAIYSPSISPPSLYPTDAAPSPSYSPTSSQSLGPADPPAVATNNFSASDPSINPSTDTTLSETQNNSNFSNIDGNQDGNLSDSDNLTTNRTDDYASNTTVDSNQTNYSSNISDDTSNTTEPSYSPSQSPPYQDYYDITNSTNSTPSDDGSFSFNLTFFNDSDPNGYMFLILIMPDGTMMIFQLTIIESQIINTTQSALKISNNVLEQFMVYLSASPLIYLVLGNLQFFTISSLYALLNVPLPNIIYSTLQTTATSLNSNMFTTLKISLNVPVLGEERVASEKCLQFGVSSLFLQNNYQYLILSVLAILTLYGMRLILYFFKTKFLYLLLDHNKSAVIFGIVISGMTQIVLPYNDVYQNSYSLSFSDKLNQSIQFLVVGVILLFGALYIAFSVSGPSSQMKSSSLSRTNENSLSGKQKQAYSISVRKQKDKIYLIFLNLFFPMLVVLSEPLYFLVFNQILLFFGLYIARQAAKFRANKIILSIYPILFHICFIIFKFSRNPSILIITEIACILIYFIGSIHELLTILFSFLHFVYRFICLKLAENKVRPAETETTEAPVETWHLKINLTTKNTFSSATKGTIQSPDSFTMNLRDRSPQKPHKKPRVVHIQDGETNIYQLNLAHFCNNTPKHNETLHQNTDKISVPWYKRSRRIHRS